MNGTAAMSRLAAEDFKQVIRHTPLVAIDLVVEDGAGRYLLGKRTNAPARGYWFVPGGRVYKNERLTEALARITVAELGRTHAMDDCRFLGIYEHFYDDNAFSEDFGTHYVVSAFTLKIDTLESLPDQQHSEYRWLSPHEIIADPLVHGHAKDYFRSPGNIKSL